MSICNECWAKWWIEKHGLQFDCRKCKGAGVIENEPQTNEEWFDTLTTKGKAEVIAQLSSYGGNVEAILEWLKEIHNDIR